jgi:mannose-6-phosphate isomerase-like protein (cupin superfamily)
MNWGEASERLRNERGVGDYQPLEPFVAERTLDRSLWYERQMVVRYAQGAEVDNTCCIWEGNLPLQAGPPPHIHFYEHEFFYVLKGGVRAWVDGVQYDATENSLLFLPCGRMHWFVSTSEDTRLLSFTVTANREFPGINRSVDLFTLIGQPAGALSLPPEGLEEEMPDPREILGLVHEIGSDFPELLDVGWRRGFTDLDQSSSEG